MWGSLNIFGKKKEDAAAEAPAPKTVVSETPAPLAPPISPSQTPDPAPAPVYAPSPWDEHGMDMGMGGEIEAGLVARAGDKLEPGTTVADRDAIATALKTVYDPEIPVDIYELGLIYEINIEMDGTVHLVMTLTAPGCPVAGILPQQVADAAASVEGVGEVDVTLVWDPPWDMEKMSEDAKLALGMY